MLRNAITQSIKRDVETLQHILENIRIDHVRSLYCLFALP